jgi:hypothetical protein
MSEYQEGYMGQYDCFEDFLNTIAKERVHRCIFWMTNLGSRTGSRRIRFRCRCYS